MKRLISFSVLVLVLAAGPMAVCQVGTAGSDELQLARIRINHDVVVEDQRVLNIFLDVLRDTGVNGGFVDMTGCSDLAQGTLNLKQGMTVREAMDTLVAANPSYEWRLEDGVVVLMPRAGVPVLLDTKIRKFQMDAKDREIPAVLQELLRLPEVREHANQLSLKPALGQGGPGVYEERPVQKEPARVHANWQNLSLLDAFNRIVRMSRKTVWIYRETDCNGDKTYVVETASDY